MDFHGKINYSIPNLIPTPNASSLQASKPLVASAGIAKRNQFDVSRSELSKNLC